MYYKKSYNGKSPWDSITSQMVLSEKESGIIASSFYISGNFLIYDVKNVKVFT